MDTSILDIYRYAWENPSVHDEFVWRGNDDLFSPLLFLIDNIQQGKDVDEYIKKYIEINRMQRILFTLKLRKEIDERYRRLNDYQRKTHKTHDAGSADKRNCC